MKDRFKVFRVGEDSEPPSQNGTYRNESPEEPKRISVCDMDGIRKKSFAQLTREALPRLDNYRISKRALKRPSLGELHGELEQKTDAPDEGTTPAAEHHGIKLGWVQGVLIPCLLNIWGVMLFLRLTWVVSLAGIGQTILIICISYFVCFVTTLSLSAISTNGEVKGGGIYYIISRSLGPEFGASVGIVFAFANAVAASMNTIGFCSSLNDLLRSYDMKIIDGGNNDIRIVGVVAVLVMIIICAVGMDWESKAQNFLVIIILVAIVNFIIGIIIGPKSDQEIAQGFVGMSTSLFTENWGPDYRFSEGLDQNFFSVFAIFFPSVTGIQAGANISGDLKDPAKSIPKGTMTALLFSMISYLTFVFFAGAGGLRDASGLISDIGHNGTLDCVANLTCQWGLHNSYTMMQVMSAWWPLIYAGCFAATLSTALTNLLSVPRLIQALGIDRIYPGLIFFSKGYGRHGEPYRGYVLTFIVSASFLLIAELNLIAPLISTFYLASYALINFCTFHAALIKPLGWRPTFRYYNQWVSLFGFLLCVAIMFLIGWVSSLITFGIIFALYLLVVYRKPDVNWGSSTQAQTYKTALSSALRLQSIGDHVKNYHPQILVLAGKPQHRPPLIDLANLITKHNSLMIVGEVISQKMSYKSRMTNIKEGQKWLKARKIKAFYNVVEGFSLEEGVRALIQASGFGKLSPNILLMGYKSDWKTCNHDELISYFTVLHNAFTNRLSVAILRLPNGTDFSHLNVDIPNTPHGGLTANSSTANFNSLDGIVTGELLAIRPNRFMHADSNLNLSALGTSTQNSLTIPMPPPMPNQKALREAMARNDIVYSTRGGSCVPKDILDAMGVFQTKQENRTIDVWWLYDDGGLTMLLPYIISSRNSWASSKIRVFALTNRRMELELEERNMANLLNKLRIDFSSLTMVEGVTDRPKDETIRMHEKILSGFLEGQSQGECVITEGERSRLQEKTFRQLRLREMVQQHSKNASLVVMSLPMPRQDTVSAPMYMSWLEILTKDMPPLLLVRGNQTSVLTFYS
ncbi:bumetanide-sensitive sodium-(potassium)-chloride cotransporter isoform X2 [Phlebotomus argentipes]|uniref:bumetanide-sensitive sodium-(potassium)-chloride cotransporter isoform X2 n=1 Tax=Phlebotomus argentipes TaxID=94469 RepID=UPI002893564D|nr:bumetanide-sensitive sodium-(potassium)-chloride cotransporter isoform X2 [Phlebotomus argentipes]